MQILRRLILFSLFFLCLLELALRFSITINLYGLRDNPVAIYNPYCDQEYWSTRKVSLDVSEDVVEHPILSFSNAETKVPDDFDDPFLLQNSDVTFYGSSFIGHRIFKKLVEDIELTNINYALPSYGLDQMYMSYLLTEKSNKNSIIIFGFLLEDIDRMIFSFRDYRKVSLEIKNNGIKILNTPIEYEAKPDKKFHFLSIKTIRNIFELVTNNYNFSMSTCEKNKKVELLEFIINDLVDRTQKNEQNLLFITFRFAKDYKNQNWRFNEVKRIMQSKNAAWLDSQTILSKDIDNISDYLGFYGEDNHLNYKGFSKILTEMDKKLKEQYR